MNHRHLPHAALAALAIFLLGSGPRASASPLASGCGRWQVTLLVDGAPAPSFEVAGTTWVLGQLGQRFELRIANNSERQVEVVVSVDGRDVIDGAAADYRNKRGYLVPAWDSLTIDGWRISRQQVAAFRFSSVAESYAARIASAGDVGVIGVAVFPERARPQPGPRPWIGRDRYERDAAGSAGASGEAPTEASRAEEAPATASEPSGDAPAPEGTARDSRSRDRLAAAKSRPGLGTGFGEARASAIHEVEFQRENPSRPAARLGLRYNDARGLRALGIDLDADVMEDEIARRRSADPFPAARGFAPPPAGWQPHRERD